MAIVPVQRIVFGYTEVWSVTSLTFNSTNTKFAWKLKAPKTGNIRKIHWRVAGLTTSQSITISLQDTSTTTGFPDGTQDQSATRASVIANTNYTETLSSDRAVTRGDDFCIVIEWTSTAGDATISVLATAHSNTNYMSCYVSGAWQKGLGGTNRGFAGYIEYDDGSIYPIVNSGSLTFTNTDFNNAGTYTELGLKFRYPLDLQICGFMWEGRCAGDMTGLVYNDSGTVLESASLDKDMLYSNTGTNNFVLFDTDVTLSANTWYHLMLRPDSATNIRLNYAESDSNAGLAAIPPWGVDGYLSRKTSGGVWSTVDTSRPVIFPLVNGIGAGASAFDFSGVS